MIFQQYLEPMFETFTMLEQRLQSSLFLPPSPFEKDKENYDMIFGNFFKAFYLSAHEMRKSSCFKRFC